MFKSIKENKETIKTVIIAVLVTAIAAFIGGMKYQSRTQHQVEVKAQNIVSLKAQSR